MAAGGAARSSSRSVGKSASGGQPNDSVQIFGRRDSRDTQKALRFFKERRVPVVFVDVARKPPAPGELRRFSQRYGVAALIDRGARSYQQSGLAYMTLDESQLFDRLLQQPSLLRLPLVRSGSRVSVGLAEDAWRVWLTGEP